MAKKSGELTTREIALLALYWALAANITGLRLARYLQDTHNFNGEALVKYASDKAADLIAGCSSEGDEECLSHALSRLREAQMELDTFGEKPTDD